MPDSYVPQRWVEPATQASQPGARLSAAESAGQESVLRVLLDFLSLARRNWPIVLTTTVAALVIVGVLIRLDQPIYRALATIKFEDKGRALSGGLGSGNASALSGPTTDPLLTQIQVMQSRGVASEVVRREGLRLLSRPTTLDDGWVRVVRIPDDVETRQLTATFSAAEYSVTDGRSTVHAPFGTPARVADIEITIMRHPGVESVILDVIPLDRAIENVLLQLRGRPRERTDIIDVTFQGYNPAVAQRVVNSAVTTFQDLNARSTKQESVLRRKFIEERLTKTVTLLGEAEASHNRFRSRERVFSSQDKLRAQQTDLAGIELRRQELSADRGMYARLLQSLQDTRRTTSVGERMNALVSSPGIAANAVVANLYAQLTRLQATRDSLTTGPYAASADNPDVAHVNGLIASTSAQIVGAVRGQLAATDARLAALGELKAQSAGTMSALPTTEAEESGLLAQVDTYRKEAERLREELQKAQIEEAAQAGQIEIIDLATRPHSPIGSGKTPRVLLALLLGVALGSLIAYVKENYSSVIRRREDVERISAATILAIVPPFLHVATRKGIKRLPWAQSIESRRVPPVLGDYPEELVTMVDVQSHAAESYRTLRTNLLFSTEVSSLRQLLVTSSGPSEGKSTTSANLAITFAQQGKRVLLIDCDLRRPRLHKMFRHAQMPGLTNALVGGISHAEVIRPTGIENLSVMMAGPTPPNPVELLGSERMRELLERLSQNFDLLVLDTPPVLVASDATILSRHVDGTVFVVRAGQTQTAALRDGIERLAAVGTHILGTVVNDPEGQVARFASYYGEYYNAYYEASPA